MPFTPKVWKDGPAGRTPITAAELARIENGLSAVAAQEDSTRALAEQATAKITPLETALKGLLNAIVPIGAVLPFWGLQEPTGWLLCKGQAVSRTDYKELFAVIGIRSGAGNGTSTFNVPDLRERVIYGVGDSGSFTQTMGAVVGETAHTLTISEMPSHTHSLSQNNNAHTFAWGASGSVATDATARGSASTGNQLYTWQGSWNATVAAGGGAAFPVRPRGTVANYIIRAK